ncbi:hypothetical protein E4U46_007102 [Claviceps purpurea]|nr:hypothetical protein E4U46_007102 [Claviceps purpurea]
MSSSGRPSSRQFRSLSQYAKPSSRSFRFIFRHADSHNLTACKMAGVKNEARRHGTTVVKVPQGAASDGLVDPFDDGRGSSLADAEMASSRPAIDFDGTS